MKDAKAKRIKELVNQIDDTLRFAGLDLVTKNKIRLDLAVIKMLANDILNPPDKTKCTCLPPSQFVKNSAEDLAAKAMCPVHQGR